MTLATLSLDVSSAGAPSGDAATLPAPGLAGGGEAFAGELARAQSALPAGQNLAANGLPLQAVALGPTLEVITPPTASPDGESLAEFARAQGLDDEVVAWLFSDATQAQVQAQAIPIPPGVIALPAGATPASAVTGAPANALASALAATTPPVLAGALPAPGTPVDQVAAAAATTAGWLQQQLAGQGAAPAAPGEIDPAQAAATPLPHGLLAAATAAARGARADAANAANAPARLPIPDLGIPVEILALDIQEGLENLWDDPLALSPLEAAPAGQPAGTGAGTGHGGGAGAATPGPALPEEAPTTTLSQRAAGYQELSQRLGEALAQRVISQIERGNWEVRLLLKPARLGEIEIDLALRSGALDASFRASNPVTRDLLNDGLPRLREVLANAGMDIAGLNVGSGQSQQTGGNPTPRPARGPEDIQPANTGTVSAAPAAPPRLRDPGSGWDVLV